MDFLPNDAGRARSAILDLVGACKALPDFDTLQIVRFPAIPPPLVCSCVWSVCNCRLPSTRQLENQMKELEEWAMDCLKKPRPGCQEGEGRKTTLRVIKFRPGRRSVKVEEREVQGLDSSVHDRTMITVPGTMK